MPILTIRKSEIAALAQRFYFEKEEERRNRDWVLAVFMIKVGYGLDPGQCEWRVRLEAEHHHQMFRQRDADEDWFQAREQLFRIARSFALAPVPAAAAANDNAPESVQRRFLLRHLLL